MSDALKQAKSRYKKKVNRVTIEFSLSENDLFDFLERQAKASSKAGYLKELIRKDMENDR